MDVVDDLADGFVVVIETVLRIILYETFYIWIFCVLNILEKVIILQLLELNLVFVLTPLFHPLKILALISVLVLPLLKLVDQMLVECDLLMLFE